MSEGLAQGPFVAARVEFEPATFQAQGTELTSEPPSLAIVIHYSGTCPLG